MITDAQFAQLAAAVGALQNQTANIQRDSAFAPSQNDPYVVPGPRDFYSYTSRTPAAGLGPAGSATATTALTYQIEADSYFYLNALSYQADIALAAITDSGNIVPLVTVILFDSGSGRNLMANPVPLNAVAGYNGAPFRLPKPRRFAATAQITATLTNYSAATTYNISLTLSGFKVYVTQAITVNGPIGS